ncbi:phosphopantetheine-binding protein [Kitasatospora sp. NBC_00240]|uniref:phosphopantetheine-binding protein n=1 Tax=Kitasatospora sp. NBC_00240 TaxID=2903567 RepID=UPI00225B7A82|nr:phosphopantetheine-binding protein [Kitasatospora sp. NBC_00240]MCX5214946.1 phosphopantetheine-binding protein [Kitasatospora sp. NBC_00240]
MSDSAVTTDAELRGQVLRSIGDLLPRVLKRELAEVPENACLFDDLGLTSAGTLELILELEESLDIQVDVEEIGEDDLRSVASLADFVAGHVIPED